MKIKKQEMINLWNILEKLSKTSYPIKFSYFIAKNKSAIKDEVDILTELAKAGESFKLYDNKRAALARELSEKDPNGNPIIQNNAYVLTENQEAFDKQLEGLRIEYKKAIENNDKKRDEVNKILQEDYEFKGFKIDMNNLPNELTPELMEMFLKTDLIEE